MKAAIYLRVSTEEQARPGHVSLQAQRETCRAYCEREGHEIVEEIEDVQSGLESERAGYQHVLALARERQIDCVVAYHFDRFSRDPGEALSAIKSLRRNGVAVKSATSPTDDPFLQGLYFLLGEQESRRTSQRVQSAMRSLAQQGKWIGRAPFGYDTVKIPDGPGSALEPNADMNWVRRIFSLWLHENHSIRSLASQLAKEGLTINGHPPQRNTLYTILRNHAYLGKIVAFKEARGHFAEGRARPESEWVIADGLHPAIIDEATWEAAQEKLRSRRFNTGNPRRSDGYLLTGVIYCQCGSRMHAHHEGRRAWAYYRCYARVEKRTCDMPNASGMKLHAEVKEALRQLPISADAREGAALKIREEIGRRNVAATEQHKRLLSAKARHERDRQDYIKGYLRAKDVVSPHDYHAILKEVDDAVAAIDAELAALSDDHTPDLEAGLAIVDGMTWDDLSEDEWGEVIRRLVKRVEVQRGGIRIELHEPLDQLMYDGRLSNKGRPPGR